MHSVPESSVLHHKLAYWCQSTWALLKTNNQIDGKPCLDILLQFACQHCKTCYFQKSNFKFFVSLHGAYNAYLAL